MNEQMKEYGDSVQECQGSDTESQARAQIQSLGLGRRFRVSGQSLLLKSLLPSLSLHVKHPTSKQKSGVKKGTENMPFPQ